MIKFIIQNVLKILLLSLSKQFLIYHKKDTQIAHIVGIMQKKLFYIQNFIMPKMEKGIVIKLNICVFVTNVKNKNIKTT